MAQQNDRRNERYTKMALREEVEVFEELSDGSERQEIDPEERDLYMQAFGGSDASDACSEDSDAHLPPKEMYDAILERQQKTAEV